MSGYFAQYFSMGGYAVFIWPSYLLGAALLIGAFAMAARRLDAAEQALGDNESDNESGDGDESRSA